MRRTITSLVWLVCYTASAQYPLVRTLEVRTGQHRPAIKEVVQDGQGLLWVNTDEGVLRTDGERTETILSDDDQGVQAIARANVGVLVMTRTGHLMQCTGAGRDTLAHEDVWAIFPVSAMAMDERGAIWIATRGKGIQRLQGGKLKAIDTTNGLPDDHVNDLDLLPDGSAVVATDQGLAVCTANGVQNVMGEAEGAPDNLTLCVHANADGTVWAGTDRSGVFQWKLNVGPRSVVRAATEWVFGPVQCIRVAGGMVWAGSQDAGPIAIDLSLQQGTYHMHAAQPNAVIDLLVDAEGAVWWCDGTEVLYRADPNILFVPEHEGLDLRHITALCTDALGRIWFATADGLFDHVAYFSEERTVSRVAVPLQPKAPIVSLCADPEGNVWAATFGNGVYVVHADGRVEHFTTTDGLINDNVLAVRSSDAGVLFATLEGVSEYKDGVWTGVGEAKGFVFDVTSHGGATYMATDGEGIRFVGSTSSGLATTGKGTYYSLLTDPKGELWAAGPGSGLCNLTTSGFACIGADEPPFDGDLFALGACGGRIIAFGSTGVAAYDPAGGSVTDITSTIGLEGVTAELNVATSDASGALWFGCSKGLVRIRPSAAHFDRNVPVSILAVRLGNDEVPLADDALVTYDRNTFTVRFTGLHYTDPSAVRFEYRLLGLDTTVLRTRDREVSFAALRPGEYVYGLRATTGDLPGDAAWTEFRFTIEQPWWQTGWAIACASVLVVLVVILLVRAREQRIRYRDRMEQEKVRFQLDALRSQVDPHFLFNSFNALVELIESDPSIAVQHVEQLSTFFRSILQVRDRERITLGEELGLLMNYFALEQRRFGDAIRLEVLVSEEGRHRGIVPLTLQLLVENALKHNVVTGGEAFVIIVRERDLSVEVENALRPKLSPPRSTGFGIDSITRRYAALTDRPVEVVRDEQRFTVRIPLIDPIT